MNFRQHRYQVSCEIDGQTYQGNYWVAGMILVVSTAKGGASTQLSQRSPEALAKQLLRKLVPELTRHLDDCFGGAATLHSKRHEESSQ